MIARQAVRQLLPGRAAVGRLEDAAVVRRVPPNAPFFDEALLLLPERRVDDVRIARIDADVVAADVLVLVEHLLERRAAVGRAEDAALGVRTVRMAERRDEQPIRIAADRPRCSRSSACRAAAEMRPRLAGVGGLVDAVADRKVGPDDAGAACRRRSCWDRTARPRSRRSIRSAGCRRAASRSSRSRSSATRRRCRSRCRRRCVAPGTPASARARPARGGPIERQCISAYVFGGGAWAIIDATSPPASATPNRLLTRSCLDTGTTFLRPRVYLNGYTDSDGRSEVGPRRGPRAARLRRRRSDVESDRPLLGVSVRFGGHVHDVVARRQTREIERANEVEGAAWDRSPRPS